MRATRRCIMLSLLVYSCVYGASMTGAAAPIGHALDVTLVPSSHHLVVQDTLTLPPGLWHHQPAGVTFFLHQGLTPEVESGPYTLQPLAHMPDLVSYGLAPAAVALQAYTLHPLTGSWPVPATLVLRYHGKLYHPLRPEGETHAGRVASPGLITDQGVVLAGTTWWLPVFGPQLVTFDMTVHLPEAWDAVSQGHRTRHTQHDGQRLVRWESPEPMETVYLIAGPFTVYEQSAEDILTYAFLRQPDPTLAATYLQATADYLALYTRLLGPYPFRKFAVVENFWETGYGMPSFTLLGSQVLRLPLIVHSSYPHEILHSWWGNAVFVDASGGNWCEGLTAYLADHLLREAQGQGAPYRRDMLQSYRNYVHSAHDVPLTAFVERHSAATQAIGYGKALMLWHMLRLQLGDALFITGLRRFYTTYRFQRATFSDLAQTFAAVSGRDLNVFFTQWLHRTGAPQLTLHVTPLPDGTGRVEVQQVQPGPAYVLTVPVVLTYDQEPQARQYALQLETQQASLAVPDMARLRRVEVDPQFDLFRRLERQELPPTLGQLFGAERVTLILPGSAGATASATAWRDLAAAWPHDGADVTWVYEDALSALPTTGAIWILGQHNRWGQTLSAELRDYGAGVATAELDFGTTTVAAAEHSFVFVTRHPTEPEGAVGWLGSPYASALPVLLRKLPHYGNYSYLAFSGPTLTNTVKGQWPVLASPLVWTAPGTTRPTPGILSPRRPLAPRP